MDWVRYRVGFYGSTRTYHGVFAQHGLEELGLKLHKMSLAGEWDKLAAEVSDDVVHLFAAVGTYDPIPGAIAESFGGVADWISFEFAPGIDPHVQREVLSGNKAAPGTSSQACTRRNRPTELGGRDARQSGQASSWE